MDDLGKEIDRLNAEREERIKAYTKMLDDTTRSMVWGLVDELVNVRKSKKLTQQNIADKTGFKTSNIARFEAKKTVPTFQFLEKYASAIGKEITYTIKDK